jgi:2-keto-4-pentenoate hydratase/2-oxohepta-3-ene-1,7-dioic acid hydratase in catechol pathway
MHLVTCRHEGRERVGGLHERNVVLLPSDGWPASMLDLIAAGPAFLDRLRQELPRLAARPELCRTRDRAELLAPIPRPRKNIMCLGLNYKDHAEESMRASAIAPGIALPPASLRSKSLPVELPEYPVVFTKSPTSVTAPESNVPAHAGVTHELDWEVELGVVIGTGGRAIPRAEALAHVFGYTVINDLSARDLQFRHKQWFLGKSLDGFCPMGPTLVTADEIPDPQALKLACRVNGVTKQDSSTAQMIFDVATIIETLSRGMTLEPGDVIATGTPAGVGFARQPPEFLKAGDVVECEIEKIGVLRNCIV